MLVLEYIRALMFSSFPDVDSFEMKRFGADDYISDLKDL